jgi:TRAP-type uncharacterized transport system fused permease subunit
MNNFQGGVTASQLTPQAYKNSSQETEYQDTISGSDIQQSGSFSVNNLKSANTLKVVDSGQNSVVLGTSTAAVVETTPTTTNQSSSGSVMFGVIFLAVSVVLAVYFVKKFNKLALQENE